MCVGETIDDLEEMVMAIIDDKHQLWGSPFFADGNYHQAMVKYEDNE